MPLERNLPQTANCRHLFFHCFFHLIFVISLKTKVGRVFFALDLTFAGATCGA